MLLIETDSISNMGRQKLKVVWSLRYLTNTQCVCQVARISKSSNDKQKSVFFLIKNWHVTIQDFKKQKKKDLIFWIVTSFNASDYRVLSIVGPAESNTACTVSFDYSNVASVPQCTRVSTAWATVCNTLQICTVFNCVHFPL